MSSFFEGKGKEKMVSRFASEQRVQTGGRSSSSFPLRAIVNVSTICTDHLTNW